MRYDSLYLAATGVAIPALLPIAEAIESGLCTARDVAGTGALSVGVAADGEAPPHLAVRAARQALDRAGDAAGPIDLLVHATVYYQGHDLWPAPSYVQRVALGNQCPAVEVRQMSNGGMAAIELAAGFLSASPDRTAALVTAADVFAPPGFDRFRSDPGTVYGDGGVAAVLSRCDGFARIRSLVSVSDPELEGMHRGDDPFGRVPFSVRQPMDLDSWKRDFVGSRGQSFAIARVAAGLGAALKSALADAETTLDDIDRFVLPHLGRRRLDAGLLRQLNVDAGRTTWEWSRTVGHLGAGDQIAGLDWLASTDRLRPGELCLVVGVGGGFTWSCAVIEVIGDRPLDGGPGRSTASGRSSEGTSAC